MRRKRNEQPAAINIAPAVVQPGDRLIMTLPDDTTPDTVTRFREAILENFPDGKVTVVCGAEVYVIRKADS